MLKRKKDGAENAGKQLFRSSNENQQGALEQLMDGYSKLVIEDPVLPFREENLQQIADNVDYGVLKVLDGTWVSYNANYNPNVGRKSNGAESIRPLCLLPVLHRETSRVNLVLTVKNTLRN